MGHHSFVGILFFLESPHFDFSCGKGDGARTNLVRYYGIYETHNIEAVLVEMEEKLRAQDTGNKTWYEIFTAREMLRRVLFGVAILAFQQLSGANYFFCTPLPFPA
jgi:SP family sugar:H+ symporter-like MFS transporter